MGDRALIVLTDNNEVSPTIYLHWSGEDVPSILERLQCRMGDHTGDVPYSAARFVQEAIGDDTGNLSFGIWNTDEETRKAVINRDSDKLSEYSHGDAGFIVVDVDDYSWKAYGGYLEKR